MEPRPYDQRWPFKMTPKEKQRRMHEARMHLRFCVKIYKWRQALLA